MLGGDEAGQQPLGESLMELLKETLDYLIIGLLGTMSFVMVWFVVERWLYYRRVDLTRFTHPQALNVALTRHLTIVSSIGANAPYIGLLGTVLGTRLLDKITLRGVQLTVATCMIAVGSGLAAGWL